MISRFSPESVSFNNLGLETITPIKCTVGETLNGEYSVEMIILKAQNNCRIKDILYVPTPFGNNQPFRIYSIEQDIIDSDLRIAGRHVFYDLLDNFLENVRAVGKNGAGALECLLSGTQFAHPFTCNSNIDKNATAYWEYKNPVEALIGSEDNSFINRWGGDIERNKFDIYMHSKLARSQQTKIHYSKNLQNCGLTIDESAVITRIMPTGLNSDGQTVLKLPEKYVDSEKINNYLNPKIQRIHYSNIRVGEDEGQYPTEDAAFEALRAAARNEFANGADTPKISGIVSIIDLEKTEEYKELTALEKIYPFDEIAVSLDSGDIVSSRMMRYTFNAIIESYETIEFGDMTDYVGTTINKLLNQISQEIENSRSDFEKAWSKASELIVSALGGYCLKRENELLIMDTPDPLTATKVWRFNLNGLGYSSTGYNGDYKLAITMDGAICADFITTGSLVADLIKGGMLTSKNGASWINMDDGTFCFRSVKSSSVDLDTGEVTQTYEDRLKLDSSGKLSVFGTLKSTNYPNFSLAIGKSENQNRGAFTVTDNTQGWGDLFQVYAVATTSGKNGAIWTAPFLDNAEKTNKKGIVILPNEICLFSDGRTAGKISEAAIQGAAARIQTMFDTISLSSRYSPHPNLLNINYYPAPPGFVAPQIFKFGNGTEGGLADIECNTIVADGIIFSKNALVAGSDSAAYENSRLSVFGNAVAAAWLVSSNQSLKENIQSQDDLNALERIKYLKFYSYDFKKNEDKTTTANQFNLSATATEETAEKSATQTPVHIDIGLMADEAPAEIQGACGKTINLYSYISLTAKAVQEIALQFSELQEEIKKIKEIKNGN